jgi:hypothetical protein
MWQHLGIALRLLAAHPTMDAVDAYRHAEAAVMASTERVKPEILLAIAFTESKFDSLALSRVEGGKRRAGRWEPNNAPKGWRKGTSLFCGPLQTQAKTWDACLAQRELRTAYETGVKEIEEWLDDEHVRGNISRALAGFGCGTQGAKAGTCHNAFQARVLAYARRIETARPLPKT